MPHSHLTGHERRAIAGEIRHRESGNEPQNFTDQTIKELKALLRGKRPIPMAPGYNKADPRR